MPLVVSKVVRCALNATWNTTVPLVNIIDMYVDSPSGSAARDTAVDAMVTDVRDAWQSTLVAGLADNYRFTGLTWVDMDTATGRTGSLNPNTSLATQGTGVNAALPPNVAALVTKKVSAQRGARSGRFYICGLAEGDVGEDGVITSAIVSSLQTRFDNLYAAIEDDVPGGVSQHPVVVHITEYETTIGPDGRARKAPTLGVGRRCTAFTVQALVATQRRRLRR